MKELSIREIAKHLGMEINELKQLEKTFPKHFDAIVTGASLLARGISRGEILFFADRPKMVDMMVRNTELQEVIDDYRENTVLLNKRIIELEGVV